MLDRRAQHVERDHVRGEAERLLRFVRGPVRRPTFLENGGQDVAHVRPRAKLSLFPRFGILTGRGRRGRLFGQQRIRRRPEFRLGFGELAVECRQPPILFGGSRLDRPELVEGRSEGGLALLRFNEGLLSSGHIPYFAMKQVRCQKNDTILDRLQRPYTAIGPRGVGKVWLGRRVRPRVRPAKLAGIDRHDLNGRPFRPVGPLPVHRTMRAPQGFPDRAPAAGTLAHSERPALTAAVARPAARQEHGAAIPARNL